MLGYDDWPPFLIHYDRARAEKFEMGGEGERVLSRSVGRRERRVGGGSSQRGVSDLTGAAGLGDENRTFAISFYLLLTKHTCPAQPVRLALDLLLLLH